MDTDINTPTSRRDNSAERKGGIQPEALSENAGPNTAIIATRVLTRIHLVMREYGLLLGGEHRRNIEHDVTTIAKGLNEKGTLSEDPFKACTAIIQELGEFYENQIEVSYIEGDLQGSMAYLATIYELFHTINKPLPKTFFVYYREIWGRLSSDSMPRRLYNILDNRMFGGKKSESGTLDPETDCPIKQLIELATEAKSKKKWKQALKYQLAIVARSSENYDPIRALFLLAIAYSRVNDITSSLETLDEIEILPSATAQNREEIGYLRNRLQQKNKKNENLREVDETILLPEGETKITTPTEETTPAIAKPTWPRFYEDIPKDADLSTCNTSDLIGFSMQAQRQENWGKTIIFQSIIAERTPEKAVAHITLSKAFNRLGRLEEALVSAEKAVECPDYYPSSRTSNPVGIIREKIAQRDAPAAETPSDKPKPLAHERIAALLAQADIAITEPLPVAAVVVPKPVKTRNKKTTEEASKSVINISNFSSFVETVAQHGSNWTDDAVRGTPWKKIPDAERAVMREYLTGPAKWVLQRVLKGAGDTVLQSLDAIEKHAAKGAVNRDKLRELQERYMQLSEILKEQLANELTTLSK